MERIILRHLSGSKANQVEEFPLDQFQELVIGRDPSATVKYDPDRDDLVSRQHAKITRDATDPTQFTVTDLKSRNGTYVNKQRIIGIARIVPGDVIQLGPGGPEFEFDIEPRPAHFVRPTREAALSPTGVPSTRESDVGAAPPVSASPPPPESRPWVGKATMERMISQTKSESQKYLIFAGGALLSLIVLVAGILIYQQNAAKTKMASELASTRTQLRAGQEQLRKQQEAEQKKREEEKKNAPLTSAEIAERLSNAVTQIEVGWHLIYTVTGGQLYHRYIQLPKKVSVGGRLRRVYVPAYLRHEDGTVEPYLTTEQGDTDVLILGPRRQYLQKTRQNQPIGDSGSSGSGFVVGSEGFILTNAHVAASWEVTYEGNLREGLLVRETLNGPKPISSDLIDPPADWVPSKTRSLGGKLIQGKVISGKHDYLDVVFPKTKDRIPARLVRTSDRHDVALIKVEVPQSLRKVELYDNYDSIKVGDAVTVLGYPAVSAERVAGTVSENPFSPGIELKTVADPTLSAGHVGKILRSKVVPGKDIVISPFLRDSYQLTVNSTGGGNSGGPVFDNRGRVIGIFYASRRDPEGTRVTFAIPIRYGTEVMGTTPLPE